MVARANRSASTPHSFYNQAGNTATDNEALKYRSALPAVNTNVGVPGLALDDGDAMNVGQLPRDEVLRQVLTERARQLHQDWMNADHDAIVRELDELEALQTYADLFSGYLSVNNGAWIFEDVYARIQAVEARVDRYGEAYDQDEIAARYRARLKVVRERWAALEAEYRRRKSGPDPLPGMGEAPLGPGQAPSGTSTSPSDSGVPAIASVAAPLRPPQPASPSDAPRPPSAPPENPPNLPKGPDASSLGPVGIPGGGPPSPGGTNDPNAPTLDRLDKIIQVLERIADTLDRIEAKCQ